MFALAHTREKVALTASGRSLHSQHDSSIVVGVSSASASRLVHSPSQLSQLEDPIPEALSDEAMRVIQALSHRLSKLKQQLVGARRQQEQAAALLEERGHRCGILLDRREQAAAELQQTRSECLEVSRQEKEIHDQIDTSERELVAIQANQQERCVPQVDFELLNKELQDLISQLAETRNEGDEFRGQIAREHRKAATKQQQRQSAKEMSEEQEAAERDEVAVRLHSQRRQAGPSVEKQKVLRAERCALLSEQREQLEQATKQASEHSLALEERMESVRMRNRQVEAAMRRSQETDEREITQMREEARRRSQQIKVLSDLLRGPLADPPPHRSEPQAPAVMLESSLEQATRSMYFRNCVQDAAAKDKLKATCKSAGRQAPSPSRVQLSARDEEDLGSLMRESRFESCQPDEQPFAGYGHARGTHNYEVTLHDEDDHEVPSQSPVSTECLDQKFDFLETHMPEPEMVSDAVLVYNPSGGVVSQGGGGSASGSWGDCTLPEQWQRDTQSSCTTAAPTMTAQQERILQLQKLTEGWDMSGLTGDAWSVGSGGTRSGDSLSTDLSGPLMSLQEESLGSACSEYQNARGDASDDGPCCLGLE